jgi:hypothetical protein
MSTWIPSQSARLVCVLMALIWLAPAEAQQLSHKVMGAVGLLAGSQPDSGLYILDSYFSYGSNEVFDGQGHRIPVGFNLDLVANLAGFQVTFKLPWSSMYMNVAVGVPYARLNLSTLVPEVDVDTLGLGDLYVQPLEIGWKRKRMDVVTGYAFYAPTGAFKPKEVGGIGAGQWTHEFSLGGALYFDRAKTWNISALTSYDLNQQKEHIDITRGDTFQFQGGAGKILRLPGKALGTVNMGVAGYGLLQVRHDRGADLPPALSGLRDQVFGLGPEIDVTLAPIRSRFSVRYCRDVRAVARPLGNILVLGLAIVARR